MLFSSASKIHVLDAPNMVNWSIMTPCASTEGEAATHRGTSNKKCRGGGGGGAQNVKGTKFCQKLYHRVR